jgi:YfiR/HmsC-like
MELQNFMRGLLIRQAMQWATEPFDLVKSVHSSKIVYSPSSITYLARVFQKTRFVYPHRIPLALMSFLKALFDPFAVGVKHARGLALLLAGMVFCIGASAQTLEVPVDVQVPLLLKATTFDRTFATKLQKNGVMQVGIVYQEKNRASVKEMEELQLALTKPAAGFKLQVTLMPLKDGEDLSKRREWADLTAVYITSLRGTDLAALLSQTHNHKVLSVSTDPDLAAKGTTMSFELVGSRPKFVINRAGAAAEGCDFSSQLLKLATIY